MFRRPAFLGTFVIEHVLRGHWGVHERERIIKDWADYTRDRLSRYVPSFKIVIEQEPGSGGKESAEATIRNLAGHICVAEFAASRHRQLSCGVIVGAAVFIASSSLLKIEACVALISNSVLVSKTSLSKSMHWVKGQSEPIGQHPGARRCRVPRGRPMGNDVVMHLGADRRFTPSRQHAAAWPVREVGGTRFP